MRYLAAFCNIDFGPGNPCLEGTYIHHNINFVSTVIDRAHYLVEFGFGHGIPKRETCDGNQFNVLLTDLALGAFHPKWWNTDAIKSEGRRFNDQAINVSDHQRWTQIGMFDKLGKIHPLARYDEHTNARKQTIVREN